MATITELQVKLKKEAGVKLSELLKLPFDKKIKQNSENIEKIKKDINNITNEKDYNNIIEKIGTINLIVSQEERGKDLINKEPNKGILTWEKVRVKYDKESAVPDFMKTKKTPIGVKSIILQKKVNLTKFEKEKEKNPQALYTSKTWLYILDNNKTEECEVYEKNLKKSGKIKYIEDLK